MRTRDGTSTFRAAPEAQPASVPGTVKTESPAETACAAALGLASPTPVPGTVKSGDRAE